MKKCITLLLLSLILLTGCSIEDGISVVNDSVKIADQIAKEHKTFNETTKKESVSNDRVPVEFVRVVDGDTIKVIYEGKEESVRYLLMDTPESKDRRTCVQPYAKEASQRNEELLKNSKVTLEFEKSARDKYGRLLAYVFADDVSVQETLIREGYARVAYIYEPPYKYLETYQNAEQKAKSERLRIWSKSGYSTEDGFNGCI